MNNQTQIVDELRRKLASSERLANKRYWINRIREEEQKQPKS